MPKYILDKGLINKGELGELVARLLLILAHDRAAVALSGKVPSEVRYSIPIPFKIFLRELVGDKDMRTILQARPDNIRSNTTFETAFKDTFISRIS